MEYEFPDKIDSILTEYLEYRKAKEILTAGKGSGIRQEPDLMNTDKITPVVFTGANENTKDFRWFPKKLNETTQAEMDVRQSKPAVVKDNTDEYTVNTYYRYADKKELAQVQALSDDIAKLLEPFAVLEVDKMDYKESPIYSDLDKETVEQMSESAYTNATLNVTELGDIEAQAGLYTKEHMIRALIRELILKEIFYIRRRL